jgi:hypothetical protein
MRNFSRTLTPERVDVKVAIHADGRYTYSYEGVLIFAPALLRAIQVTMCARCEAQLRKLAAQLFQEGFHKAEYLGGGRYSVFFEDVRQRGEPLFFLSREMPAFSITPNSTAPLQSEPSIRTRLRNANSWRPAQKLTARST